MDLNGIRQHWEQWARQYGTELRATTKTSSAKLLEVDALIRTLSKLSTETRGRLRILEVGCGNGWNCIQLAEAFPESTIAGMDLIEEMVAAAIERRNAAEISEDRMSFFQGNVLDLPSFPNLFDVVFTDRCLINLNTDKLQQQAIGALAGILKPGGYLLMIENSLQTYELQNRARESVGLQPRIPASFNHFFDETQLRPFLPSIGMELVDVEDFISLHDLVLYILVPMTNGGVVDYAHPMVNAAAQLNMALSSLMPSGTGSFGQNRLFVCRKQAVNQS